MRRKPEFEALTKMNMKVYFREKPAHLFIEWPANSKEKMVMIFSFSNKSQTVPLSQKSKRFKEVFSTQSTRYSGKRARTKEFLGDSIKVPGYAAVVGVLG